MADLKTVDDQTLEWWVLGTPGTFCGVPNNHDLRRTGSDPLDWHYEETEHIRDFPVLRLDPELRLCPQFDSESIALFPVATREEMGFRVLDNFCEEHIQ